MERGGKRLYTEDIRLSLSCNRRPGRGWAALAQFKSKTDIVKT